MIWCIYWKGLKNNNACRLLILICLIFFGLNSKNIYGQEVSFSGLKLGNASYLFETNLLNDRHASKIQAVCDQEFDEEKYILLAKYNENCGFFELRHIVFGSLLDNGIELHLMLSEKDSSRRILNLDDYGSQVKLTIEKKKMPIIGDVEEHILTFPLSVINEFFDIKVAAYS